MKAIAVIAASLLMFTTAASAAIIGETAIVQEQFDYTTTSLNGANGGIGWGGAWVANYNATAGKVTTTVQTVSLSYAGETALGGSAQSGFSGDGNNTMKMYRAFADSQALTNTAGNEIWLTFNTSFYACKTAGALTLYTDANAATWNAAAYNSLPTGGLFTWAATTGTNMGVMKFLDGTALFSGDSGYTVHEIAVKIAMRGAGQAATLSCFVDPDLSVDPATWTATATTTRDFMVAGTKLAGIEFVAGRASTSPAHYFNLDNILLGTVPEPATMTLLGLGGLAMLARRRK